MNATLKEKIRHEAKSFAVIFIYVWAILGLFALHKDFLLQRSPLDGQLLALINAAVLGKVILVLEMLKLGERRLRRYAAVWRILAKSIVFGLLLLAFHVIEEAIGGWFHHKTFSQSLAGIDGGRLLEMGALAVLIMVALAPYFFLREIVGAIGRPALLQILFCRPGGDAEPPG
jgi:hypothetical protein